jgi:hypothetical protein
MHYAAHMIGIVSDAEAGEDCIGKTQRGPTVGVEPANARSGSVQFNDAVALFSG